MGSGRGSNADGEARAGQHGGGLLLERGAAVAGVAAEHDGTLRARRPRSQAATPAVARRDEGAVHAVRAGAERAAQARGAELEAVVEALVQPVEVVGLEQRIDLGPGGGVRVLVAPRPSLGPGRRRRDGPAWSKPRDDRRQQIAHRLRGGQPGLEHVGVVEVLRPRARRRGS